ncbi:2-amino-4-hydroxy-6-hydroxymethyldihydropteridine diphosphokinase [Oricola cellulosilytica]|uniref:2-amino-4-hydroxy-6-hydroxymethyldihydropteridine pyrophosphokinase n=2 Tax=Oricola cellulosilytica TaxID=1429082 RepID=A0A4R0P7T6_9HYPH|nr:2-amino-4-hydroxy-6-hydroxymethyldihydropteridine diphosphokinase [Oricola cellulosilytica]
MRTALDRIDNDYACRVMTASSVYRTPPWGPVAQDWYLNACVKIATSLSATSLLELVLATERSLGRVREQRWGPRTIDIDILLYGDEPVRHKNLTIPHPRMKERAFVMVPLAELAGGRLLDGRTISEYASGFENEGLEKTEIRLTA